MHDLVLTAGALSALTCLVGVGSVLAGGSRARLVEIQLGTEAKRVHAIVGNVARRQAAQRSLKWDYVFIVAYWATFTELAVLIAHREGWGWIVLGLAAALAAVTTALSDALENIRTTGVLAVHAPGSQLTRMQLGELRRASLTKWAVTAVTVALLAGLFAFVDHWLRWLALAFLAIAALGFVALRWRLLITPFFLTVFAAAVFIAVLFLGWPETVVRVLG